MHALHVQPRTYHQSSQTMSPLSLQHLLPGVQIYRLRASDADSGLNRIVVFILDGPVSYVIVVHHSLSSL